MRGLLTLAGSGVTAAANLAALKTLHLEVASFNARTDGEWIFMRVYLSLTFVAISMVMVSCASPPVVIREAREVSVDQLLGSPNRFDGTHVLVKGFFLMPMVGDMALYQTEPDYHEHSTERGVRLDVVNQKHNWMPFHGYAINTTPRNLPTAVLLQEDSDLSRSILKALENTAYFRFTREVHDVAEFDNLLLSGKVLFGVEIPRGFERAVRRGDLIAKSVK